MNIQCDQIKNLIYIFLLYFDESFIENQYYLHTKIINHVTYMNFLI